MITLAISRDPVHDMWSFAMQRGLGGPVELGDLPPGPTQGWLRPAFSSLVPVIGQRTAAKLRVRLVIAERGTASESLGTWARVALGRLRIAVAAVVVVEQRLLQGDDLRGADGSQMGWGEADSSGSARAGASPVLMLLRAANDPRPVAQPRLRPQRTIIDSGATPLPEVLLTRAMLREIIPVSDMSIWRWLRAGLFPRPIKFNGRCYWRATEVQAWIDERARSTPNVA